MGKRAFMQKEKRVWGEQNPYLRRSDDYGMRMKHKMMTYDSFLGAVW